MERISFLEVVDAVAGEVVVKGESGIYNNVSMDTRTIKENDIFIALKGENFNANDFVVKASESGAALCIVDEINFDKAKLNKKTAVIKVADSKKALLRLAKYYLSKLDLKVIGITGSTGKTSTKDLTSAVLSSKFKVFKTIGNFNNEIGLPMMIFKLDNSYGVAVLEMGMSDFCEIHNLCEVAKPDIAIITNVGLSHIENLKTRENILKAKMEITDFFHEDNVLIINADNDLLKDVNAQNYKLIKTGIDFKADFKACDLNIQEQKITFKVLENNDLIDTEMVVNVPGRHNILNSLLAIACGREMGMNYEEIAQGFKRLEATSMRLDIIKGAKITIINDCYNASPDSMIAAIDVLCNISGKSKIAILGTMRELGDSAFKAHKEVAEYARLKGIDLLITLGEYNEAYKEGFNDINRYRSFKTYAEVISYLQKSLCEQDVILVKASRYMKFESIVSALVNINLLQNNNIKEVIEK